MALIPVRKPYYITQFIDNLAVSVKSWPFNETEPVDYQYTINKVSFTDGVAEDLAVDISPFIKPVFVMEPLTQQADGSTTIKDTEYLNVRVLVNAVDELHTATNGWEDPSSNNPLFDTPVHTKNIHNNTRDNLTINNVGVTEVDYIKHDGSIYTLALTVENLYHVIPVKPTALSLLDTNTLRIDVKYATGTISYNYKIVCPFDRLLIGFVNSIGTWEYITFVGRNTYSLNTDGETYVPGDTHSLQKFGVNGYETVMANTGIMNDGFTRVLNELFLSEHVVLNNGGGYVFRKVVLETPNYTNISGRARKIVNYELRFRNSDKNIPTI